MKICKLNDENKFECILTIYFQNLQIYCNILRLNEMNLLLQYVVKNILNFGIYSNIATINKNESSLCLLGNDLLCVRGDNSKGFYLIKISTSHLLEILLDQK